jgi:hypothetical protein
MRRILWLAALGALALPATASAQMYVSPEAQKFMDQRNAAVTQEETDPLYEPGDDTTKSCPNGRAKRIGFRWATSVELLVRLSLRLKICPVNGRPGYWRCGPVRHGSPGRGWTNVYGPVKTDREEGDTVYCKVRIEWKSSYVIDQYWVGMIRLEGKVNGNSVWFPVKQRFFE